LDNRILNKYNLLFIKNYRDKNREISKLEYRLGFWSQQQKKLAIDKIAHFLKE